MHVAVPSDVHSLHLAKGGGGGEGGGGGGGETCRKGGERKIHVQYYCTK